MINYIQNCAFIRYMKYDYWKAPKWLRKFYDFAAKRINLFLNWYYEKDIAEYMIQVDCFKYSKDTDYYIDFLWMPKPPNWEEKIKITEENRIWVEFI